MKILYRMTVILLFLLTACAAAPQSDADTESPASAEITETETTLPSESLTDESSEPESEPETEPSVPEASYTGESHLFDECGVLNDAETAHYNEYLDNLSNSRLICAAAVITDSLGGVSPETFAQNYYRNLYGTENGFLVLINNDSGKDVIYREGLCTNYLTDTALPVAQATPHLVEGDYAGALDILLPVGERMPEYIFDFSGSLTKEQLQTFLETAETHPERRALLLKESPQPAGEQTPEQALAAYAEDIRSRLQTEMLLVMDVSQKHCVIAGAPPELLASEVQTIWNEQGLSESLTAYYETAE